MPFEIDPGLIIPIILAALGCNLVCLIIMLAVRPARRALAGPRPSALAWACRAGLAEAAGTALLVWVALLGLQEGPYVSGLLLAALLAALGPTSGAHLNPAVTLGLVAVGRLHPAAGLWYWLCQLGGAAAAAALHSQAFGPESLTLPAPETLPATIVLLEAVGTALLVLAFVGTTCRDDAAKANAPLATGAALAVALAAVGPHTGGVLNPARYFGPAILGAKCDLWALYLAGPLLGGMLAAAFMRFFVLELPAARAEGQEEAQPRLYDGPRRAA